jgi:hypothetical protein
LADPDDDVRSSCEDVAQIAPPVAFDDTFSTSEDTALKLPTTGAGGPAANDTDADALSVVAVSNSVGGTASISADTITFTPADDMCGDAAGAFDYTVSDGHGGTDLGLVTVDVSCVQDDPAAEDDSATVAEDGAAVAVDVLANDTDVDGGPMSVDSVTQPTNGTVAITGGGTGLSYQPDPGYCNGASPVLDLYRESSPTVSRARVLTPS